VARLGLVPPYSSDFNLNRAGVRQIEVFLSRGAAVHDRDMTVVAAAVEVFTSTACRNLRAPFRLASRYEFMQRP
jgi:hypothetical protein